MDTNVYPSIISRDTQLFWSLWTQLCIPTLICILHYSNMFAVVLLLGSQAPPCFFDPLAPADRVELHRLEKLAVLQSPDTVPEHSKVLSTRFVRTWREKHDSKGNPIWLRRSRFVVREFAWLEPERESFFSPASGRIISRILPTRSFLR